MEARMLRVHLLKFYRTLKHAPTHVLNMQQTKWQSGPLNKQRGWSYNCEHSCTNLKWAFFSSEKGVCIFTVSCFLKVLSKILEKHKAQTVELIGNIDIVSVEFECNSVFVIRALIFGYNTVHCFDIFMISLFLHREITILLLNLVLTSCRISVHRP